MQIANPIYDTVFKYLMEDTQSAILLLSSIIDEPIVTLEFLPQENTTQLDFDREQRSLTVYRLDFCAKIKTKTAYKQVLIEIQKAKLPSDIMRFRRYLGEQYRKRSNTYHHTLQEGEAEIRPLPIISIYFLGYALKHIKTPVIKVNRHYYDVVHQKILDVQKTFIESLTHDSYVIQISRLREPHQSELEQLLAIFDQDYHLPADVHILEIDEQNYPLKYRPLVRRLQRAIAEPQIRQKMDIEDEVLADLQTLERTIAKTREERDKAQKEKAQALAEKAQAEKEKALAEQEKEQALGTIDEQAKLIAKLRKQLSKN